MEHIAESKPPTPVPSLSKREVLDIVMRWFIELEDRSEQWWATARSQSRPEQIEQTIYNLTTDSAALAGTSRHYEADDGSQRLDPFLKEKDIAIPKNTETYARLRELFGRAVLENKVRSLSRVTQGDVAARDPLFRDMFSHTPAPFADCHAG